MCRYRNANHRSINIGATAPQAQNLAVPNHTIINLLIFIPNGPLFFVANDVTFYTAAVSFSFYGADLNSDEAGKYAAAPPGAKILRFEIM